MVRMESKVVYFLQFLTIVCLFTDLGKEKSVSLTNATSEDVLRHVQGHGTAKF